MRLHPSFASGVLAALVAFGCGGDAVEPPPQPTEPAASDIANQPPIVEGVDLEPSAPRSGEPILLNLKARDPDGDDIDVQVDWYRNGQLTAESSGTRLDTTGFRRGDQIHAEARVSDGRNETKRSSGRVRIANTPPTITRMELFPQSPAASHWPPSKRRSTTSAKTPSPA